MGSRLTWGIIGTGRIAGIFAEGLAGSRTGTLLAVGSRAQRTADLFGDAWNVPRRYGSYEAVLADHDVQVIYIATPHPLHAEWAIKAAEAGKHILCEKPVAMNAVEAATMIEAARRHNVFFMEAYMYRCHPQTLKLKELLHAGAIGQVRVIQATFSFDSSPDPEGRLFKRELGGGGILDVGGYCASIVRLVAGAALGQHVVEPLQVVGTACIGATGVDEYAVASLRFPCDILAQLFCGVQVDGGESLRIYGSEGMLEVATPFTPHQGETLHILLTKQGQTQAIAVENDANMYALEVDTVAKYLDTCQAPVMPWDDTLGNMRTLDRWRAAIGLIYDKEDRSSLSSSNV